MKYNGERKRSVPKNSCRNMSKEIMRDSMRRGFISKFKYIKIIYIRPAIIPIIFKLNKKFGWFKEIVEEEKQAMASALYTTALASALREAIESNLIDEEYIALNLKNKTKVKKK